MKPPKSSALWQWKIVEDTDRELAVLSSGHPHQSFSSYSRSSAEPWTVKWCCCRLKVFALRHGGRNYCRCGYPIKRSAIYVSPVVQALWPIGVIIAIIGLVYAVTTPMMNWDSKPPDCDNIVLACLHKGEAPICDNILLACAEGG